MLILGLLSLFQVCLLPGLLLIRLFKSKRSFIHNLSMVFTLSLLANYVGVLLLTTFGLYRRSVSMAIFALELALLLWLYRGRVSFKLGEWLQAAAKWLVAELRNFAAKWRAYWPMLARVAEGQPRQGEDLRALLIGAFSFFGLLGAVLSLGWMSYLVIANIGTVFNAWDSWATWEPWSRDWYLNRYARETYEYPQLIPINWSITYRFIGSEVVKFFAKAIMPLFTLMSLLLIWDLGRRRKSFGFFLGVGLAFYAVMEFMAQYIGEGYVDLPVAALSLLVIYSLLVAQEAKDWASLKDTILLGSLASAAATVTKQQGAYIAVFYPILLYVLVLRDFKGPSRQEKWRWLLQSTLLAVVIVAPWYLYVADQIGAGGNISAIPYVTDGIYQGASLSERFIAAFTALKGFGYIYPLLLLALPWLDRTMRWLVLTIVVPFMLLWGFFLSYEYRNLAVDLPLTGMVAGVAIEQLLRKFEWGRLRRFVLPAILVIALAWASTVFTAEYLTKLQNDRQRDIFEPQINTEIYTHFANHEPGLVLSPYPVGWLPGLGDYWVNNLLLDYADYQDVLTRRADIAYVLIYDRAHPAIWADINAGLGTGAYLKIFREGEFTFIDLAP